MLAIKLLYNLILKQRFHLVIKFIKNAQKRGESLVYRMYTTEIPKRKKKSKIQKIKELQDVHGRE